MPIIADMPGRGQFEATAGDLNTIDHEISQNQLCVQDLSCVSASSQASMIGILEGNNNQVSGISGETNNRGTDSNCLNNTIGLISQTGDGLA